MTEYRAVARHVRYWRGAPHKWSTVFPLVGTAASADYSTICGWIYNLHQDVCYPAPGAAGGGCWEVALYDQSSGGVPVFVVSHFDPDTVGDWIPYDGTAYEFTSNELESAAEVAMVVEWGAGLSSSGKPVSFKKWFHAVPANASSPPSADVTVSDRASIAAAIQADIAHLATYGLLLGNSRRLAAATPVVSAFYGNHPMPRGRRRRALAISGSTLGLPPGLLTVPGSDGSLD